MSGHTPSPWRVVKAPSGAGYREGRDPLPAWDVESANHKLVVCIATSQFTEPERFAQMERDAHLIASAPELLAALEAFVERHSSMCHAPTADGLTFGCVCDPRVQDARSAVAKAKKAQP